MAERPRGYVWLSQFGLYPLFFLFGLCMHPASAWSAPETYALDKNQIKVDLPFGWRAVKDLYGMPLQFFGPVRPNGRAVVSITPTGQSANVNSLDVQRESKDYAEGRKRYLKSRSGKLKSILPVSKIKTSEKVAGVSAGVDYEINGTDYVERTYYLGCKFQVFHLKSLVQANHPSEDHERAKALIRSFSCE